MEWKNFAGNQKNKGIHVRSSFILSSLSISDVELNAAITVNWGRSTVCSLDYLKEKKAALIIVFLGFLVI